MKVKVSPESVVHHFEFTRVSRSDYNKPMSKRPRDINQLAKMIVDESVDDSKIISTKSSAAATLGRLGGLKGGHARAARLSAEDRSAIAKRAATVRWAK